MAQTKRKRKTKHRGNAAGIVETRGRTGRPLTAADRKASASLSAAQRRDAKMAVPPTWTGAAKKALIPTGILAAFFVITGHPGAFFLLGVPLFALYVAMSYYVDLWTHRRYVRKKAGEKR